MFSSSLTPKATPLAFGFGAPAGPTPKAAGSGRSGASPGNGRVHPARSGMISSNAGKPQGNQGSFRSRPTTNSSPGGQSTTSHGPRKPQANFQARPSTNSSPSGKHSPAARKPQGSFQPSTSTNASPLGNDSPGARNPQGSYQSRAPTNASPGGNSSPAGRKPQGNFQSRPPPVIASPAETASPVSLNAKKRKRPSGGNTENPYEKREQIKATQNNLQKLMKRIGGGNAEELEGLQTGKDDDNSLDGKGEETQPSPKKKQKKKTQAIPVGLDGKPLRKFEGVKVVQGKPNKTKVPAQEDSADEEDEEVEVEIPVQRDTSAAPSASLETALGGPLPTFASPTSKASNLPTSLQSAKFRWLNEQLYTRESKDAVGLMRGDNGKGVGGAFDEYHASHRHLTSHWPSPPLQHITESILSLPHTSDGYLVVDLGCGDAGLAKSISMDKENGKGKRVLSFDLVGDVEVTPNQPPKEGGGWVVPGDFLSSIPLPGDPGGRPSVEVTATSGSAKKKKRAMAAAQAGAGRPEMVDIAVCCLSLMGVNWVGGVYEACRVMRKGGALHIAEVTSRLVSKEGFIGLIESFGFELEEHTTPTTHFDLFRFSKTSEWPLGVVRNQPGWDQRVKGGEKVLKGCVYKKR